MRFAGVLLFATLILALAPSRLVAKGNQVRGIDPETEPDLPINRPWKQFEPDRKLRSPASGPYDPIRNLRSPLEITRAEAASYIGWARRHDCAEALVTFLARRSECGPDVTSALWALGQVGTPAAIPVLIDWTRRGSIDCRIEALKSLAERRAPEALPAFIEGLTQEPDPADDPAAVAARKRLCFQSLVRLGDATCLPALRKLEERNRGLESWSALRDNPGEITRHDPGREAVALLAACGDRSARSRIVDAIHRGSRVTEPQALLKSAAQGGNLDGFPWGFWIGKALLIDNPPRPTQWPALGEALELLKERPLVLDAVLREAAARRGMPDGGKALLLGCLSAPGPADFAVLETVWRNALGKRGVIAVLAIPAGKGDHFVSVPCNLNASAVIYALSRLRDTERLERLWVEIPANDRTLRGDLTLALARSGSRRFIPLVADYVVREWDRTARSPELERRLGNLGQAAETLPADFNALEYSYRSQDITTYLLTLGDRQTLEDLVLDPALHPYVRVYWIQRLLGSNREPWMLDLATDGLARLESEEGAPRLLSALRTRTRQAINSLRNRSTSENAPLQ